MRTIGVVAILVGVFGVACPSEGSPFDGSDPAEVAGGEAAHSPTLVEDYWRASLLQECHDNLGVPYGDPLPFTPPTVADFIAMDWRLPLECYPPRRPPNLSDEDMLKLLYDLDRDASRDR